MKYFLIGYMGSGKTSIGKLLSNNLKLPFYDLDAYIEKEENQSISEIFKTKGEIYFRNAEHEILKKLLSKKEPMVLALGGGTPCYAGNMDMVIESGISLYLHYPLEVLVDRLWDAKESRPIIAHLESKTILEDFIRKHLFERNPYYMQATYNIRLLDETLDEAVQKIQALLQ